MPLNIGPRCGRGINDILISEHTGPSLGPRQKRELAKSSNFPPADPGPGGRERGPARASRQAPSKLIPYTDVTGCYVTPFLRSGINWPRLTIWIIIVWSIINSTVPYDLIWITMIYFRNWGSCCYEPSFIRLDKFSTRYVKKIKYLWMFQILYLISQHEKVIYKGSRKIMRMKNDYIYGIAWYLMLLVVVREHLAHFLLGFISEKSDN